MKRFLPALLVLSSFWSCQPSQPQEVEPATIHAFMQEVTDRMVHDIFSPPVVSRVYAYVSTAGYEAYRPGHPELLTLAGQLHGLTPVPAPSRTGLDHGISAIAAMNVIAVELIFSYEDMQAYGDSVLAYFRDSAEDLDRFDASVAYGEEVGAHMKAWMAQDNYAQMRTFPKYEITDAPMRWRPTPPNYMDGIEPHWREHRTWMLDSAQQFKPARPSEPSLDTNSQFWKDVMEVYTVRQNSTGEEEQIAQFWDCNPYMVAHRGHVMTSVKKISPGGHWLGITKIAGTKANLDLTATVELYARVSVAMADAFISCWDEKYRSNYIRPETVINEHLDPDWLPLLQTPPFPEYTSGHSVVSGAASEILTHYLGDSFVFTDSTERVFGLPDRSYENFYQARNEAAVSRLYGGIHFRPAIDNGVKQGTAVGALVVERLKTR
jgi:hypothetical protein